MRLHVGIVVTVVLVAQSFPSGAGAQTAKLPGHVVDIQVGEFFVFAPDSIPAGLVTLKLTQIGDVTKPWPADIAKLRADPTYYFHMIWLVRLDSARTFADLFEAARDRVPARWAKRLGGPGFAHAPGSSNVSMLLTPGNYALVCYVGAAQEDRNRSHLLKGMIRPLTVTARPNTDSLPGPELTIVLRADSVLMPDTLKAGSLRILVMNDGERSADFAIGRVKKGYTLEQVRAWRPNQLTEPPRQVIGGVVFIAADQSLMTTVELEPGDYLFAGKHVVVNN
jgi:hypothetical protein